MGWFFKNPSGTQDRAQGSGQGLGRDFLQAVTGQVISVRHGEHLEDDGATFGIELLTVACRDSGKKIICAVFSNEAGYGAAKAGQRVNMSYRSVLDPSDYGTSHKVDSIQVFGLRQVK